MKIERKNQRCFDISRTGGWIEVKFWEEVHSIAKRVDSDLFLARSGCGLVLGLAMYVY